MGFILSANIQEYDINSANISIFMSQGNITKEEYDYYNALPKYERNVKIGLLMKDRPELINLRKEGLEKYTKMFIEENGISKHQVIEIASDAVWFHSHKKRIKSQFGEYIKFKKDRNASIMYSFKRYAFYYSSWDGSSFVRGYTKENEIIKEINKILHMVETSNNKKSIYESVHLLKKRIYLGELSLDTIAKDLINDLITSLDNINMI